MIKKAVIPAAGLGTRFLPATKSQPKEMLPIVDTPTIQYVVEEAIGSGIKDILIIIGRGKSAIIDHFDRNFELEYYLKEKGDKENLKEIERISNLANLYFIRQKNLKGLGDAVGFAEEHINREPFALLLGDTIVYSREPCTKQLISIFEKYKKTIIGIEEVSQDKVSRYGIIKGKRMNESLLEVEELIEKPSLHEAPSNLAIAGRYIITPEIFDCIRKTLPGKNNEIQITDALRLLDEKLAYIFEGKRYDIGDKMDYLRAQVEFGLRREEFGSEFKKFLKSLYEKELK